MYNYKEIVTKTIVGKGKKTFKDESSVSVETNVDTVLGCWVINHDISGYKDGNYIKIDGSYDVNIWYSYDNNTKTGVINKRITYNEKVTLRLKEDHDINDDYEIIIRSLKNPSCIDVSNDGNNISFVISKELGIEVVGDTKIKIPVSQNEDEYDILIDENDINDAIDKEVNVNYLENK